ncbi:hypothetical protein [Anaerostipes faecalis]|uniref:hypothetical protein n=1 Tax=Anaerostipes faecalis TaxID=2738446 RepID=UPI001C1E2A14|nr:hypothetical protein [Anaerostipes faecalis]
MVSHWLAWISFGFSILLLMKFVTRKSSIKKLNRTFSKLHRSFAIVMFVTGLAHGIISLVISLSHIAPIISGILLFGSALYVCLTCIHKENHKKTWMKMHRVGSVILTFLLIVHLILALNI